MANLPLELAAIFNRSDPATGELAYSDESVLDALGLMVLSNLRALDPSDLPEPVTYVVGWLCARAGIEPNTDPTAFDLALRRYFAAHPLPEGLERDAKAWAQRCIAERDQGTLCDNIAALIGTPQRQLARASDPPPEGSVRAGPLLAASLAKKG